MHGTAHPLGDLRHASGFDDRGTPLALRKPRRLFLVGIDASKRLAVGVIDGHKIVMMTPAAVLAEFRLFISYGLAGGLASWFGHSRSSMIERSESATMARKLPVRK